MLFAGMFFLGVGFGLYVTGETSVFYRTRLFRFNCFGFGGAGTGFRFSGSFGTGGETVGVTGRHSLFFSVGYSGSFGTCGKTVGVTGFRFGDSFGTGGITVG